MESANNQANIENLKINEEKEEQKEKEEFTQFVKLFDAVLQENRGNLSNKDIETGVEIVVQDFDNGISDTCNRDKLNELKIMCGFFHRYSPLFAGKTRRHIAAALLECKELRSYFKRESLKIVDLGGGAGSDLVGLYSAIYDVQNLQCRSLKVTGMDYNENWKIFFNGVHRLLTEEDCSFGNASKLLKDKNKSIECSFACLDVFSNKDSEKKKILEFLEEADVILMKGVVTTLKSSTHMYNMTKRVASAMKTGSLLLYIDSPTYDEYFYQIRKRYNLRLVFYTERDDVSNCVSEDMKIANQSTSSDSSEDRKPSTNCKPVIKVERSRADDVFDFLTFEVKQYGRRFADYSNQEIYIYVKE